MCGAALERLWFHYVAQHLNLLEPWARREMTKRDKWVVVLAEKAKVNPPNGDLHIADKQLD